MVFVFLFVIAALPTLVSPRFAILSMPAPAVTLSYLPFQLTTRFNLVIDHAVDGVGNIVMLIVASVAIMELETLV